jgi:hypothetical protein
MAIAGYLIKLVLAAMSSLPTRSFVVHMRATTTAGVKHEVHTSCCLLFAFQRISNLAQHPYDLLFLESLRYYLQTDGGTGPLLRVTVFDISAVDT